MPLPLPLSFARRCAILLALTVAAAAAGAARPAAALPQGDEAVIEAREALRKKDGARLAALRDQLAAGAHPLAAWADYWEIGLRLAQARQSDLEAFYARWPGSYVEDRLRNDWLLELGRRRDWANFALEFPRFRMNDDREVTCYALLTQHLAGQDVAEAARAAWHAQRDLDDGCNLLASTLVDARQFGPADLWREARLSVEFNRPRAARAAAALVGAPAAQAVAMLLEQPARWLAQRAWVPSAPQRELAVLALLRLAASDAEAAAAEMQSRWQQRLEPEQAAAAWAGIARQAAMKLAPQAADLYHQAWQLHRPRATPPRWSDDVLAWNVRAALRSTRADRWTQVAAAIDGMSAAEQKDPAWTYWKARALQARARKGEAGDADREAARALMQGLAATLGFYGKLAADELGLPPALPAAPLALTEAELGQAVALPGLQRGMLLAALGLRDEGRREWNFTLRGMGDRELMAAAHLACEAGDWQLCINTSERTRGEIDLAQRYPMPFRREITSRAQERSLDPAFVFGLIRQETRFMSTLRSHAGATGLMQLMPATARWTAKRIGLELRPEQLDDVDVNLRLGTMYLKVVLDDFAGSQPLAAAAYNAGPGRPRRWREGPALEPAAWAENIPFNETRDYVKKVLSNAVVYGALLGGGVPSLKQRLGTLIGPREAGAPGPDREIP